MAARRRKKSASYYRSKAWMAKIRGKRKGSKKRRRSTTRRNEPAPRRRVTTMAKRKRRAAPRRAPRRRTYRRNQPRMRLGGGRIIKRLTDGATGAFQVLVGKAAARSVPQMIGLPQEGAFGIAVQAGVGIVVGMIAHQMFGKRAGDFVLAGALTAPLETVIVTANIPILSPALSAYPGLMAYPELPQAYTPTAMMSDYPAAEYDVTLNAGGNQY